MRERELKIVRAKVPGIGKKLSEQVVGFVQALRKQDLFKSPGVAETLDWAGALTELDAVALDPATVSDTLGVLLKYQDDIARLEGAKVKELLDQVQVGAARGGVSAHGRCRNGRSARREYPLFRARACAPPAFRSGRARCSMRWRRCRRPASARADDFYWTLHAVFVKRHEHSMLFDQAFRIFFRKRGYLEQLIAMMLPRDDRRAGSRRQPQARSACRRRCSPAPTKIEREKHEIELDARFTVSDREVLQKKDFAQMTRGRDRRRPRTRSSAWCCRSTR